MLPGWLTSLVGPFEVFLVYGSETIDSHGEETGGSHLLPVAGKRCWGLISNSYWSAAPNSCSGTLTPHIHSTLISLFFMLLQGGRWRRIYRYTRPEVEWHISLHSSTRAEAEAGYVAILHGELNVLYTILLGNFHLAPMTKVFTNFWFLNTFIRNNFPGDIL